MRALEELVGVPDRKFAFHIGESITVDIADPGHPMARRAEPWQMTEGIQWLAGRT